MKNQTPYLVVAGVKDSIIDSSDAFVRRAKEVGVPVTYMRISDMDHYVRKEMTSLTIHLRGLKAA